MKIALAGVPVDLAQIDLSKYYDIQIKFLYLIHRGQFRSEMNFILSVPPEAWLSITPILRLLRRKIKHSDNQRARDVLHITDAKPQEVYRLRYKAIQNHVNIFIEHTGKYPKQKPHQKRRPYKKPQK